MPARPEAGEEIPPVRFETLGDMVRANAGRAPGAPALLWEADAAEGVSGLGAVADKSGAAQVLTHEALNAAANRFAAALAALGFEKGGRAALLLGNRPEFVIAYYGAAKAGVVTVPINNRLSGREISYILSDSGARLLIVQEDFWPAVEAHRRAFPALKEVVWAGAAPPPEGVRTFGEFLSAGGGAGPAAGVHADDLASICYTSGTTGLPKGALLTHRNILVNGRNCEAVYRFTARDRTLIAVPLFHVTGLTSQLIAMGYVGASCVLMPRHKTEEMMRLIEKFRVSYLIAAPTIYVLMLMHERCGDYDMESLRVASYGGGPIAPETIRGIKARFPAAEAIQLYGLTETSGMVTYHPDEMALEKPTSVGKCAPECELCVVDDSDRPLPPGEVGELCARAPNVVAGYWGKEEATAEAMRGGWFHTGDYARCDPDGYYYILDRKKDMICRGAENIYSKEVEDVLYTHPAVMEAALYGIPDEVFGEIPRAGVVLRPGKSADAEEIRSFCAERLAGYKVPAAVFFLEALPRNASGKILKRALRESDPSFQEDGSAKF